MIGGAPKVPRPVLWIGGFLAVAAVAGFVAVWIGLAPIAASSGHWKITSWLLHFAMRNAVELRAMTVPSPPPLDAPERVLRGAAHYASGCAPCHGAPGRDQSVVARQMTPKPPLLRDTVDEWAAKDLFWIVRNGVKFTAMPAWPALERTDEVWDMVAFLRALPDMTAQQYRSMAEADAAAATRLRALDDPIGSLLAGSCARCHGDDGLGRAEGAFPKLAGQREAYLLRSLLAFATGQRHSGFMQPVAAALTERELRALAAYYAALPPFGPSRPSGAEPGRAIADRGVPDRKVPACRHCHGPKDGPTAEVYPRLAGQHAGYLETQLAAFSQGSRGGTAFAPIMGSVAHALSETEAAAVAAYYASLGPEGQNHQGTTAPSGR